MNTLFAAYCKEMLFKWVLCGALHVWCKNVIALW